MNSWHSLLVCTLYQLTIKILTMHLLVPVIVILSLSSSSTNGQLLNNLGTLQQQALQNIQNPQTLTSLTTNLPLVQNILGLDPGLLNVITNVLSLTPLPTTDYPALEKYNVGPQITISGISGGGSFSMMLSFIHSSFIKGAGIYAGAPYLAVLDTIANPANAFNVNASYPTIYSFSASGAIDDVSNLASNFGQYIYHGIYDPTPAQYSQMNYDQFVHYGVPESKIKLLTTYPTGHCIPIQNGTNPFQTCYGDQEAICKCDYQSTYDLFGQLFPTSFVTPTNVDNSYTGLLTKFNQKEFFPNNDTSSVGMWDFGYLYVPQRCQNRSIQCKLHFAFHGCSQNEQPNYFGGIPEFISSTGYLSVADANDIVMVFPQARINLAVGAIGCFDLYGFTSPGQNTYSTRNGKHPAAIKKMYQRILNGL